MSLAGLTAYWQSCFPESILECEQLPKTSADVKSLMLHDSSPALCLAKSEVREEIEIRRRYDIDSFVTTLTSLAAIRVGMKMHLWPHYNSTIRRPFKFPLLHRYPLAPGETRARRPPAFIEKLATMKNMHIGSPYDNGGGMSLQVFIFFPSMKVGHTKEQHLDNQQLQQWTDRILLPALQSVVENDTLQHLPPSWAAVSAKGRVRSERVKTEHDSKTGILSPTIDIAGPHLGALWDAILRECCRYDGFEQRIEANAFQDPLLVMQAHGIKTVFKRNSAGAAIDGFLAYLDGRVDAAHLDDVNSVADLGIEEFPARGSPPTTLIAKKSCVKRVMRGIANLEGGGPNGGHRMRQENFYWAMTRDGVSMQSRVASSRTAQTSKVQHTQFYHTQKEMFATAIKGYVPFGDELLEELGVFRESTSHRSTKQAVTNLLRTSHRVATALHEARGQCFGARWEFGIRLSVLRRHRASADADEPELVTTATHRPYWVLPTPEVNAYMKAAVERLLWPIARAATKSEPGSAEAASFAEQHINGATAYACVRLLQMLFHGQQRETSLWGEPMGLGLGPVVEKFGTVWLTPRVFDASTDPPSIRPPFWRNLTLLRQNTQLRNYFVHEIGSTEIPRASETWFARKLAILGELLDLHPAKAAAYAAELVVQAFIHDVFKSIYNKWKRALTDRKAKAEITAKGYAGWVEATLQASLDLTEDDMQGLNGLDLRIIEAVSGQCFGYSFEQPLAEPVSVQAAMDPGVAKLKARQSRSAAPGPLAFLDRNGGTPTWQARLELLLWHELETTTEWRDRGLGLQPFKWKRPETCSYARRTARIVQCFPEPDRHSVSAEVVKVANRVLWAAPASSTNKWMPAHRVADGLLPHHRLSYMCVDLSASGLPSKTWRHIAQYDYYQFDLSDAPLNVGHFNVLAYKIGLQMQSPDEQYPVYNGSKSEVLVWHGPAAEHVKTFFPARRLQLVEVVERHMNGMESFNARKAATLVIRHVVQLQMTERAITRGGMIAVRCSETRAANWINRRHRH